MEVPTDTKGVDRVLFAGQFIGHSRWRFNAFRALGVESTYVDQRRHFDESSWRRPLDKVEFRLKRGAHIDRWNQALLTAVDEYRPRVVWIDKGLFLRLETIRRISATTRATVHCLHDDFRYPLYQGTPFEKAIPYYDLHLVTRPVNVSELDAFGARQVIKFLFSYEPSVHRPVDPGDARWPDAVFIGHFESGRDQLLGGVVAAGATLGVWGPEWGRKQERYLSSIPRVRPESRIIRGSGLWGDDYARAFSGGRISLGLLSRRMRDEHTCRSMEIPACEGLLLAERTPEHMELYEDGTEAVFFSNNEELSEAVGRLMHDGALRMKIARSGHRRAVESGYDHLSEARRHLKRIGEVMR
jgi:spore maturation protein CgeB